MFKSLADIDKFSWRGALNKQDYLIALFVLIVPMMLLGLFLILLGMFIWSSVNSLLSHEVRIILTIIALIIVFMTVVYWISLTAKVNFSRVRGLGFKARYYFLFFTVNILTSLMWEFFQDSFLLKFTNISLLIASGLVTYYMTFEKERMPIKNKLYKTPKWWHKHAIYCVYALGMLGIAMYIFDALRMLKI